ncbi:DUF6146 family protein [Bizionia arctica]|uniref:Uncharacterized protein n=1 Tax=Bizionia arctica TaxID=1495645 RepID=A0A917GH73_9FLAO|nr:DUF6146 family protein [Bizionia arctica]GGG45932.1 hypothetical protein GCM10010976_16880 [Bizionia arctica]
MKSIIYIILLGGFLFSCNTTKPIKQGSNLEETAIAQNDTVTISNPDLEYEILIIEPGYNLWLETRAKPEGYYEQSYLESRNNLYVASWNNRVMQPLQYPSGLYESRIFYDRAIDYGYDVNYKLYNYFIYFQLTYKQQLTSFIPRI